MWEFLISLQGSLFLLKILGLDLVLVFFLTYLEGNLWLLFLASETKKPPKYFPALIAGLKQKICGRFLLPPIIIKIIFINLSLCLSVSFSYMSLSIYLSGSHKIPAPPSRPWAWAGWTGCSAYSAPCVSPPAPSSLPSLKTNNQSK